MLPPLAQLHLLSPHSSVLLFRRMKGWAGLGGKQGPRQPQADQSLTTCLVLAWGWAAPPRSPGLHPACTRPPPAPWMPGCLSLPSLHLSFQLPGCQDASVSLLLACPPPAPRMPSYLSLPSPHLSFQLLGCQAASVSLLLACPPPAPGTPGHLSLPSPRLA